MQRTNLIPIFKNAYLSSHFVGWMCCVKGQKIEYSASNKETGKEYNKCAIIELTFDLIEFVCFRLSLLQMEPSIMHQLNQHRSTIFQLINFPLPPQRPQVFIHLAFQRCIHKRYLISHSINTTVYQWYVLASDFYCLRENRIFSNNLASFSFHCGSFRPWQPPHRMYLPYGRKIIKVNSIKSFPMKIFYWLLTLTVWTKKKWNQHRHHRLPATTLKIIYTQCAICDEIHSRPSAKTEQKKKTRQLSTLCARKMMT